MKNRRVFQRADCSIPVVVHVSGRFHYGDIVDMSLGGVRLALQGRLAANKVELTPNKPLPPGMAVIPLPYDVCWEERGEKTIVGLQFTGGVDAFFRGWLADHLNPLMSSHDSLLDQRKLVRVPCQLDGQLERDGKELGCAVMDLSIGGVSAVVSEEMFPGETIVFHLPSVPEMKPMEVILLRVQQLTNHFLFGGRFLDPTIQQKSQLQELVKLLAISAKASTLEPDRTLD